VDYNPAIVGQLPNESTAVIIFERPDGDRNYVARDFSSSRFPRASCSACHGLEKPARVHTPAAIAGIYCNNDIKLSIVAEGDGFEPLVPLLGRAQLSRHARGGPLPSADSLRIQLSSSMRSAAMKASGWSSMTWCLASGTSTTGARGPIRDDM